jgi:flagellar biogenesis protein FliO
MPMLQQTLAVFLVLGLLLAALWFLRRTGLASSSLLLSHGRRGSRNNEKRLCLVERLALTPQHTLHLVAVDGRFILLATSPAGCQGLEAAAPAAAVSRPAAVEFKSGVAC